MDCPTHRFHILATQALNNAVKNNIRAFDQMAQAGGWVVRLSVEFGANTVQINPDMVQAKVPNHNQCQLDILDFLRGQSGFLSGAKIQRGLEAKGIFHGDSTVKHALADLVGGAYLRTGPNNRGYQII